MVNGHGKYRRLSLPMHLSRNVETGKRPHVSLLMLSPRESIDPRNSVTSMIKFDLPFDSKRAFVKGVY